MLFAWLACGSPTPSLPPEGTPIAASVYLRRRESGGYGALLDFLSREVGPEPAWDECHVVGGGVPGGVGGMAPAVSVGETWLWVDEERVFYENPDNLFQDLEIEEPYGRWVGVGWSGGEDLEAFDVQDGLFVPELLELDEPALDGDERLDPSRELDVRWNEGSEGSLSLTLKGEDAAISCTAVDDGRFSVPEDFLRELQGEVTLSARRTSWAYHELPSGELLEFQASDVLEKTLQFEE